MKKILLLFLFLAACSPEKKKEKFLYETMQKRHGAGFKEYKIKKETESDEVFTLLYWATVETDSVEKTFQDTLLYTLTGDGIYLSQ